MADLRDLNFTPEDVSPESQLTPVPAGSYVLSVANSEDKMSAAGNKYLSVQFEILDGPHKGRLLWKNFNLWNSNTTAAGIALSEFSNLCHAVGKIKGQVRDSQELHGLICRGNVVIEKRRDNDELANRIKNFSVMNQLQGVPPQVPTAGQNPYSEQIQPQRDPVRNLEDQTPW